MVSVDKGVIWYALCRDWKYIYTFFYVFIYLFIIIIIIICALLNCIMWKKGKSPGRESNIVQLANEIFFFFWEVVFEVFKVYYLSLMQLFLSSPTID